MEGTQGMKLARVVSNSSVHISLLEVTVPRAGAAQNEWGVNSYSASILALTLSEGKMSKEARF